MAVFGKQQLLAGETGRVRRTVTALDGAEVVFRRLSVEERLNISKRASSLGDSADAETHTRTVLLVVAASLCEEDGAPMWENGGAESEGVPALLKQPNAVADELTDLCLEVNRMGKYAKDAVKEAAGN